MLKHQPNPLTGSKLLLEPLEEKHRGILCELSKDPNISMYSPALKLKFDSWFDKALKTNKQLTFVVKTLSNQKYVGSTRFYEIYPEHHRLSIGYTWYIPEVWGTFVNAECKLLLLSYAFDTLKINRIEFFVDSRNNRSRAAVKKLGASEEGILRQHTKLDDGYIRDTVVYSILKSEWPIIHSNLIKRII